MDYRLSKQGSRDINEIAFRVVGETTGELEPMRRREKDPAAVVLGRAGGLIGGRVRANKLSAEQRSEIAKKAARARWNAHHEPA